MRQQSLDVRGERSARRQEVKDVAIARGMLEERGDTVQPLGRKSLGRGKDERLDTVIQEEGAVNWKRYGLREFEDSIQPHEILAPPDEITYKGKQ